MGAADAYAVRWLPDGSHDHPNLSARTIEIAHGTRKMNRPDRDLMRRRNVFGERTITYSLDSTLACGCRVSLCEPGRVYGPGETAGADG